MLRICNRVSGEKREGSASVNTGTMPRESIGEGATLGQALQNGYAALLALEATAVTVEHMGGAGEQLVATLRSAIEQVRGAVTELSLIADPGSEATIGFVNRARTQA